MQKIWPVYSPCPCLERAERQDDDDLLEGGVGVAVAGQALRVEHPDHSHVECCVADQDAEELPSSCKRFHK